MNSEFPETRLSRLGKKIGWLFSPVLLISLIGLTLFTAEGLKLNFDNRVIERKSSMEIKDVVDAQIFLDGKNVGKSPKLIDTVSTNALPVRVTKEGRMDWTKEFKPNPGFVRTFYPILYPKSIDFREATISAQSVYKLNQGNTFFYTKKEEQKTILYRYAISGQLFLSRTTNIVFSDLTAQIALLTPDQYTIIPGKTGRFALLNIYGQRSVLLREDGPGTVLSNVIPTKENAFYWSADDSHIILESKNELDALDTSSGRVIVVHRATNSNETLKVEFLTNSSIIYKVTSDSFTDLMQISFEGSNAQKIELPNIDNIRKNNLKNSYSMLEKDNIILIQTEDNIFSFNVVTFELKKFNLYKGEKIVLADELSRKVVTVNSQNQNQFILSDLERKERKVFTLEDVNESTELESVIGFNGAENLVLDYANYLILIDNDGANQIKIDSFTSPDSIMAVEQNNLVTIAVLDIAPEATKSAQIPIENQYTLKVEQFNN